MKIYRVGGAVRDDILQRPRSETDWLVVGATEQQMLDLGYKRIGHSFPVFLHPKTREEYALARTEKKIGSGHKEFAFSFLPSTTLEEDLVRRDFTINAMVRDGDTEELIDLHGGLADIESKTLRHISNAFTEDPLRLYRGARFLAQLSSYRFTMADETKSLMQQIAAAGELKTLSGERVWKETEQALCSPRPSLYFESLAQWNALDSHFSAISSDLDLRLKRLDALQQNFPEAAHCWHWASLFLPNERYDAVSNNLSIPKQYQQAQSLVSLYESTLMQPHLADEHDILRLVNHCRHRQDIPTLEAFIRWFQATHSTLPEQLNDWQTLSSALKGIDFSALIGSDQAAQMRIELEIETIATCKEQHNLFRNYA